VVLGVVLPLFPPSALAAHCAAQTAGNGAEGACETLLEALRAGAEPLREDTRLERYRAVQRIFDGLLLCATHSPPLTGAHDAAPPWLLEPCARFYATALHLLFEEVATSPASGATGEGAMTGNAAGNAAGGVVGGGVDGAMQTLMSLLVALEPCAEALHPEHAALQRIAATLEREELSPEGGALVRCGDVVLTALQGAEGAAALRDKRAFSRFCATLVEEYTRCRSRT
jgi:hypothetical protein